MNRIILAGRITRDPELANAGADNAYVRFSIAVDRVGKNAQGERQADFFNCIAFRRTAEFMGKYVKKGNMLIVEGKMQQNRYEKDGIARVNYDVIVDNVQNVEPRSSFADFATPIEQLQPGYQEQQTNDATDAEFSKDSLSFVVSDDDLPF